MEFEIKDLEIIDNENLHYSNPKSLNRSETDNKNTISNSMILTELHKENEELQNKIKLNYRRLLLFETENNKLIEEKNKFFFETQNYSEKNQILTEQNEQLEKLNSLAENNQKMLLEKISSYEKINATQMFEIKRFSKFHLKIQDVVKPFILQLKKQIVDFKAQLEISQKMNANLTLTYKEFCKKIELEMNQKNNELNALYIEKNSLIQTYEEQIHSFSKEIVSLQGKNEDSLKEVSRLKKNLEFKNYYENEVVRFKRTHEEDQIKINELSQKKSMAETHALELQNQLSLHKNEALSAKNKLFDIENNLETTRTQFSKKIDELNITNERMARLEKLNNQLGHELSTKQN